MKRTGVVFLTICENTKLTIDGVTSLQVFNNDKAKATVNGMPFQPSQNKTLLIADGTISKIDIDVVFDSPISLNVDMPMTIIYKKIQPCDS